MRISTFRGRVPVSVAMLDGRRMSFLDPIGSMYAIYGNIYHGNTPVMLAYTSTIDPMGDIIVLLGIRP